MKKKISYAGIYIVLTAGAVTMLLPFYWMIVSAFKTPDQLAQMPPLWFPTSFLLDNFELVLTKTFFIRYVLNSVLVTAANVICTMLITILAAFAFSRLSFPGRDVVFSMLLGFMMIPFELVAITNYGTIVQLNGLDTYAALIFPYTANVLYVYILRNFFLGIPDALYYAAKVDGASNFMYLKRVMIPIAKPALVTIGLLNGIDSWNSFLWPLLVVNDANMRTVTIGLTSFVQDSGTRYERLMAAACIVVVPMILLFLFARKYIITAMARGGLKG